MTDLDLGDEVDFTLSRKMSKVSAENIRKLPKGSVAGEVCTTSLMRIRFFILMELFSSYKVANRCMLLPEH